jgi:hypothetical protein
MRLMMAMCVTGVLGLAAFTGTTATAAATDSPIRVSNGDPYASCTLGAESGTVSPGGEVEPQVSIDPSSHARFVAVYQQDRWTDGGAKGLVASYSTDGGRTIGESPLPLSACAPGGLPYERASDAWVSTGPDGTVYAVGLQLDRKDPATGVGATTSYDGGKTWSYPTDLIANPQAEFSNDKPSVTADPLRPGTAYAVWDRLDFGSNHDLLIGVAYISITHDGGHTWSPARAFFTPDANQIALGNEIVVDPTTGTLYDAFNLRTFGSPTSTTIESATYDVVRSTDGGQSWSAPVVAANDTSITANDVDPNTGASLRTGGGLPSFAIDPVTGRLYLVYEGSDFTAGTTAQVQLVGSDDGGRSWSAPVLVNGAPGIEALTPSVAVDDGGTVAVTYYDLRDLRPGNTTTLPTSTWITYSPRGGQQFGHERRLAPDFDGLLAPNAGAPMLGDYEGLAAAGDLFQTLFMVTNTAQPADPSDLVTTTNVDPYQGSTAARTGQTTPVPAYARHPATSRRTRVDAIRSQ